MYLMHGDQSTFEHRMTRDPDKQERRLSFTFRSLFSGQVGQAESARQEGSLTVGEAVDRPTLARGDPDSTFNEDTSL